MPSVNDDLPELPEPHSRSPMNAFDASAGERAKYTADQLQSYARLAVQQAMSPLAGLADYLNAQASQLDVHAQTQQVSASIQTLRDWAAAIRKG